MGGFVKCFDVVSMVAEEATKRFSPFWRLNTKYYDVLREYCGAIDSLAREFKGEAFAVDVDEIEKTISIGLECPCMVLESADHVCCVLARRALSFGFSVTEQGLLSIKFVFPSVWERTRLLR